jgi:hypothetical protein
VSRRGEGESGRTGDSTPVSGRAGGEQEAAARPCRRVLLRRREKLPPARRRAVRPPVRATAIFPNRRWPATSYNIPQAEQHIWSSGGEREERDREGRRRNGRGERGRERCGGAGERIGSLRDDLGRLGAYMGCLVGWARVLLAPSPFFFIFSFLFFFVIYCSKLLF